MLQITQSNPSSPLPPHWSQARDGFLKPQAERIEITLRQLGAMPYDLLLPETKLLPLIVHPEETIRGIVFGRYKQAAGDAMRASRGALVVTDHRILLINKKPLYNHFDEILFNVVSSVSYSRVGPAATVTLHTRLGDISLRTFNQTCAKQFVEAIEAAIFSPTNKQEIINDTF